MIANGWLCQLKNADRHEYSLVQWIELFSSDPTKWFRSVRKFCKSPYANIVSQWADSLQLKVISDPIECQLCGEIKMSYQAYSVHMSRCHTVKSKYRMYVDGHVCKVCLVNFGTRERCINHVRYRSKVCKFNYLLRGPVMSEIDASLMDALDHEDNRKLYATGKRRHQALCPCVRAHGPLRPLINERSSSHHALGFGHNYH